ncbi:Uncharacterised protein family (UPF0180) [Desulforamulus putei DSM 12395]|uniref:Uncharacterized protein family (UPF0180) n=1 Tax=Desulforamulus putei DSM 12395 TaxID=1121429 RepID=A0A1M4XMS6_9FIRM|nr:YkuS family protein [Desulforamulus putei]SHE94502.1 Uncharacterised protein family (UPF0180) [Desulforamulus putei DSM 12395]
MAKKVAIVPGLDDLSQLLKNQGYKVVKPGSGENVMAVVINGLDNNTMNMQGISTKAPVIDAAGYTPDQILSRIKELG